METVDTNTILIVGILQLFFSMKAMLEYYTQPQSEHHYVARSSEPLGWTKASEMASLAHGKPKMFDRELRQFVRSYITDRNDLPPNPYNST